MARIVMGIGTSHSPLLTLEGSRWEERAADDYRNRRLNLSDGRWVSYDQLAAEVKNRYASVSTSEQFVAKAKLCQSALDRMAANLAEAAPDVVVIIGDDQNELFSSSNMPAVSIFYGHEVAMHPRKINGASPSWLPTVAKGYAMDDAHVFPGAPEFSLDLIKGLIERNIDVGAAAKVDDPHNAGFGHAYGFVVRRLFAGKAIPIVPVLLNTYYPPNVPTPARCYDIGRNLRSAIEGSSADLRVAIVASGGLSHFVVDEQLDRQVVGALVKGDGEALRSLPICALNAGSSEIRNWIVLAAAIENMKNRWFEYQPLVRTPAGTGIGVGFGVWS
ncbi:MAG: extradiol ring-cleavage dioxygenase [Alphaproteobacteria bacterium]|nr:extradiol ring-cleavage dioxygenase [Alphaproteobacteria bacterium]